MTRSFIDVADHFVRPLSICMRVTLIIGIIQGLSAMLLHVVFGPYTMTDLNPVLFIVLLAFTSATLVWIGATGLAKYRSIHVSTPIISISIIIATIILIGLLITQNSAVSGILGIIAGLLTGILICQFCRHRTRSSTNSAPDALAGYVILVLGAVVVILTIGVFTGVISAPFPTIVHQLTVFVIAGLIISVLMTGFYFIRARSEPSGTQQTDYGVVTGIRRSPNGRFDVVAPYAADPHRIDLRPVNAIYQDTQNRLKVFQSSTKLLVATIGALLTTLLFTLLVTIASVILSPQITFTCASEATCFTTAQAVFVLSILTASVLATLGSHFLVRFSDVDDGEFDCQAFELGAVITVTGNHALLPDGSGETAHWFLHEAEKLGVVSLNDPRLDRAVQRLLAEDNDEVGQ